MEQQAAVVELGQQQALAQQQLQCGPELLQLERASPASLQEEAQREASLCRPLQCSWQREGAVAVAAAVAAAEAALQLLCAL